MSQDQKSTEPQSPVPLNYSAPKPTQRSVGASILRVVLALLLIVAVIGILLFGICAISLMRA